VQAIGAGRWSRFLADAEARAREPATVAAVAQTEQPISIRQGTRSVPFIRSKH
jgi:hypothetical protein